MMIDTKWIVERDLTKLQSMRSSVHGQDQGWIIKSLWCCIRIKATSADRSSRAERREMSTRVFAVHSRSAIVVVSRFDISNDLAHVGAAAGSRPAPFCIIRRDACTAPFAPTVSRTRQASWRRLTSANSNISLLNFIRLSRRLYYSYFLDQCRINCPSKN